MPTMHREGTFSGSREFLSKGANTLHYPSGKAGAVTSSHADHAGVRHLRPPRRHVSVNSAPVNNAGVADRSRQGNVRVGEEDVTPQSWTGS